MSQHKQAKAREYKIFSGVINGKTVYVNCKGSQWLPCYDIFWLVMDYLNLEDSLNMLSVNRYSWRILRQDVDFILYKINSKTTERMLTDWEFFKRIRKSIDFKYLSVALKDSEVRDISRLNGVHTVEIWKCREIRDISPLRNCKIVKVRNCYSISHIGDMRNICYLGIDLFAENFKPGDQDFLPDKNHVLVSNEVYDVEENPVDFHHRFFKGVKSLTIKNQRDIDISQLKCERIYYVNSSIIRFCNGNQNLRFVARDMDSELYLVDYASEVGECLLVNDSYNEEVGLIKSIMEFRKDIHKFIEEEKASRGGISDPMYDYI